MARNKRQKKAGIPGIIVRVVLLAFCGLMAASAVMVTVETLSGDSSSLTLADYLDSMEYYYYDGDFASLSRYQDRPEFYGVAEAEMYLEAAEAWEEKEASIHWWKAYSRLGEEAYQAYAEEHRQRLEEMAASSTYPENQAYFQQFRQEVEAAQAEALENP